MPSPRNRIKLTGDTHPPEVEYDLGADEGPLGFNDADLQPDEETPRASAPQAQARPLPRARGTLAAAREQVRSRPVATLVGAFVLGMLLARI
jgi:hypothetical protein